MIDWGKRVVAGALVGAAIGVVIGLLLARLLWPAPAPAAQAGPSPTAPPTLAPAPATGVPTVDASAGAELLWISGLYAHDADLPRARERLAGLSVDDPGQALADLALTYGAAGSHEVAVDLATLAAALGSAQGEILAYVATPTPTPEPTATATLLPSATATPLPSPTPRPSATTRPAAATPRPAAPRPTGTPAEPTPLPLVWDHRVDMLTPPIRLVAADVAPGQLYWKLVRMEWWRAGEGGNCLIYITTLKQDGNPKWGQKVIVEHGPQEVLYTNPKPGEPHGVDFRMNSTLNSYIVYVGDDLPSDRVTGLGMGEWLGGLDHTTFVLTFQLARK